MENESWRRHLHFDHLNFNGMKLLSTTGMVQVLPTIDPLSYTCEGWIIDMQSWLPLPSGKSWREDAPLKFVHTNICGSLDPVSLGGNRYFIIFIDDFSRKLWVYILKEKSAAFTTFKNFKVLVEAESDHKLITLWSDRDGEYTSNLFYEYYMEQGIKKQFTTAYIPQQNGIAKRKNRTILDMARTILKEKGLPN